MANFNLVFLMALAIAINAEAQCDDANGQCFNEADAQVRFVVMEDSLWHKIMVCLLQHDLIA